VAGRKWIESMVSNQLLLRQIEALLFASDTPLSVRKLSSLTGEESTKEIKESILELDRIYRETNRSYTIIEVAGGYQLATLPEFSEIISRLYKGRRKSRLSQPALETLAIIAYKQPTSRVDIEAIRGVNCDGVLSTLTERELIAITGRGEGVGKPYLYSTTRKFLEYLGLKDYRDLPSLDEIEKKLEENEARKISSLGLGEPSQETPDSEKSTEPTETPGEEEISNEE